MPKQITILNSKGEAVSVEKYDSVDFEGFVNGYAIVWLNHKAAFINENGEEICPIKYERIDAFGANGRAFAQSGNNICYLDKNGKETHINCL